MNISIFGLGYVGCVSIGCLAKNGHHVIGVDVSQVKVDQINAGKATIIEKDIDHIIADQRAKGNIEATTDSKEAILKTDISIVAVGTPSSDKGHLNLDFIFKVAEIAGLGIKEKNDFHIIAIRSTIMPGTCDKFATIVEEVSGKKRNVDFAIVDNPEFLREGTAVEDYYNPPLTLIGSDNNEAAETVASLYRQLPGEVIVTDLKIAEIMKYVNNTFHALKISFGNEIGNICSEMGIDSHKVMEIFCKDKQLNISPYYFKPGFAFGGSCLPKDLKGLQTLAHDLYVNVPVIDSINKSNELQISRAVEIIQHTKKKRIGFLGLSFKAGTDDLRNSPAVAVVETLLGKGYTVKIYDKNIHLSNLTGTNKVYIDFHIPHLSKLMVSDINDLTKDVDVIVINNKEQEYLDIVENTTGEVIIVDMVRLPESIRSKNNYLGINW
jgi:GDP-mannose 6-dehydrogenase